MTQPIRPLAVTHLREAVLAARAGDAAMAVCALMAIDPESWDGIRERLGEMGMSAGQVMSDALGGGR
jgi:hypothetical protein